MGWGEVGKEGKRGSLAGRFVQFEDGVTVTMRVLDEEPHTTRVHKITQVVQKGDKKEEVFRSIPATANPDDNWILKTNGKRYPDAMQHNLRVHVYGKDGTKLTKEGEVKILQGGPAIYKPLRALYEQYGSLTGFDISIKRTGSKRDTEYTVSAAPVSMPVNVAELQAKMMADETINDWNNVFAPVTGEEQRKMAEAAGFDIAHDPVSAIAAVLSPEEASGLTFTFGKFKDKSLGEIAIIDAGYLAWAAENVTSNDRVAAGCRVLVNQMAGLASGQSATPAALPAAKPAAPKVEKPKANDGERNALIEKVSDIFSGEKYEDIEVVVGLVKKHGGGKTKVKDLTVPQLKALYAEVAGE
jgi:hypothetical protein